MSAFCLFETIITEHSLTAVAHTREQDSCKLVTTQPVCSPDGRLHVCTICSLTNDLHRYREYQGRFLSARIKSDQSWNQTGQTARHVVPTDGEVWGQSFRGHTTHWLIGTILESRSTWEIERDWVSGEMEIATIWINKQTISFLPCSAGEKLQNCLDGVQTYNSICAGFHMARMANRHLKDNRVLSHEIKGNLMVEVCSKSEDEDDPGERISNRLERTWVWVKSFLQCRYFRLLCKNTDIYTTEGKEKLFLFSVIKIRSHTWKTKRNGGFKGKVIRIYHLWVADIWNWMQVRANNPKYMTIWRMLQFNWFLDRFKNYMNIQSQNWLKGSMNTSK